MTSFMSASRLRRLQIDDLSRQEEERERAGRGPGSAAAILSRAQGATAKSWRRGSSRAAAAADTGPVDLTGDSDGEAAVAKGVDAAGAAGNARPQRARRSREVPSLEEKSVPECEKPAAKLEGMKGALPAAIPPLAQPPRVHGGPCAEAGSHL